MQTIDEVERLCRMVGEGIAVAVAEAREAMREFFDTTYWC